MAPADGAKAIAVGVVNTTVTAEADVKANSGSAGLIIRGSDYGYGINKLKGYYACIQPGTGVVLTRFDNGSSTSLAMASTGLSNNTSYKLKVVAVGSSIKVYLGTSTTPVISVTDATYASGSNGLRSWQWTATWDNYSVGP